MYIIEPSVQIVSGTDYEEALYFIERAGRVCYQSGDPLQKCTVDSGEAFVHKLIANGHLSVLEHVNLSVRVICDRGVSHELVRHRIASYSQESTRYCNYTKTGGLTFIKPCFFPGIQCGLYNSDRFISTIFSTSISQMTPELHKEHMWLSNMWNVEECYNAMITAGCSPQEARSVLPNSLKTEIVITQNVRQWRHWFDLRYFGKYGKPHPQMYEIASKVRKVFESYIAFFEDNPLENKEVQNETP